MQIIRPKIESLREPIGVDEQRPRFSWQLRAPSRMKAQSAYRILVYAGEKLMWDSGKVVSQASSQIEYMGDALKPRTRYRWNVRVWDERGIDIGVSRDAFFETGLMGRWRARWVSCPKIYESGKPLGVATFVKSFTVRDDVESARLYVSALGAYSFELNGMRAHDTRLAPGPTSAHKRVRYQAYDATPFLKKGENEIRAAVSGGWYTGEYADSLCAEKCGKYRALIAQLHIRYKDGEEETVLTDSHWKVECEGKYRMADLVMGVHYDATAEAETPVNV